MRSRPLWLGSAACLIGAVLLLVLGGRGDRFDDSDLRFGRPQILPSENGFEFLDKATAALDWPPRRSREVHGWLEPGKYNVERAQALLARNAETLRWLTNACTRTNVQIPPVVSYEQDAPYRAEWRAFAALLSLRAEEMSRANQQAEGLEAALQIVKIGHAMEDSGGATLNWTTGSSVKNEGLKRMQAVLGREGHSRDRLRSYITQLESYRPNGAGFTNAMSLSYELVLQHLQKMPATMTAGTNSLKAMIGSSVAMKLTFSLERSRRLFAEGSRAVLEAFRRPFVHIPVLKSPPRPSRRATIRMLLRRNSIGEALYDIVTPQWESFLRSKCLETTTLNATQTLLALRCFQLDHGELPSSLSELAPAYLPTVPTDDFDGQSLRYLPDRKLLYSVGPDLEDSRGQERSARQIALDITFPIQF